MIDKKSVTEYFELMKSKGFIAEYWVFDGFYEDGDHVKIHYLHKSGKRSSYRFLTEKVLQELRDNKLDNLFK